VLLKLIGITVIISTRRYQWHQWCILYSEV